ncbi:MAG: sugar transferase [Bacteroidia bacterium]
MYVKFFKQIFDFLFALLLLIMLTPVFIIVSILIKIDSSGPVFFKQERMGYEKRNFFVFKFRSMTNKVRNNPTQTYLGDAEITRIGNYLRRYKIDELPQIINVLVGDMSIVGPRPCLLSTYNKYKNEDTDFRFNVKPGITSNAGVSGSIFLTWPEKWKMDRDYYEHQSLHFDFKIIVKSFLVVIFGEEKFLKK